MPVIGYLYAGSANTGIGLEPFLQGLKESGFVEGRNVNIEYRWADGWYDRLPAFAADLVNRKVAVIYANDGSFVTAAAKEATSTIPIVFQGGGLDPVRTGLVASLNRPGGNVTGVMNLGGLALGPKQIELLHELLPTASSVGVLVNRSTFGEANSISTREAARALRREFHVEYASTEADLEMAFANLAQRRIGALVVIGDPFFSSHRPQIVALAARKGPGKVDPRSRWQQGVHWYAGTGSMGPAASANRPPQGAATRSALPIRHAPEGTRDRSAKSASHSLRSC